MGQGACLAGWAARRIGVGGSAEMAFGVARNPPVGKPAHMTQFPQRRVEFGAVRYAHGLGAGGQGAFVSLEERQRTGAGLGQTQRQRFTAGVAHRFTRRCGGRPG